MDSIPLVATGTNDIRDFIPPAFCCLLADRGEFQTNSPEWLHVSHCRLLPSFPQSPLARCPPGNKE